MAVNFTNRAVQIDPLWSGVMANGQMLASGSVHGFKPGTTMPKPLWKAADKSLTWDGVDKNVVSLDSQGRALAYADGAYKLVIYDKTMNQIAIWDNLFFGREELNARDFGATGDGVTDDTAALQAGIDYCLSIGAKLFIPAGTYLLKDTLQLNRVAYRDRNQSPDPRNYQPWDRADAAFRDTCFTYAGLGLEGEKTAFGGLSNDTILLLDPSMFDKPAIAIQAGRGISIKRIAFQGRNNFSGKQNTTTYPDASFLFEDDLYNASPNPLTDISRPRDGNNLKPPSPTVQPNTPANAVFSPHAGIAIDAFTFYQSSPGTTGAIPADGGYQGSVNQKNYQRNGAPPSANIVIEECIFSNFVVGVLVSPLGVNANGDSITIRDCWFNTNKIAVATCGTQSRNVSITNISAYNHLFVVSTRSFGATISQGNTPLGQIAQIQGGEFSTCKYLFNISTGYGEAVLISNIYAEATLSIGFFGGTNPIGNAPVVFEACSFNLHQPALRRSVDTHCFSATVLRFIGCIFSLNDIRQPLRFSALHRVTFSSCTFANVNPDLPPLPPPSADPLLSIGVPPPCFAGFERLDLVSFDDCWVGDVSTTRTVAHLTGLYKTPSLPEFSRNLVPLGASIMSAQNRREVLHCSAEQKIVTIGSNITVTRDPNHDGVVTFTAPNPAILKRGDLVFADSGWPQENYIIDATYPFICSGPCGVIQSITGSKVTLVAVAQRLMFDPTDPSVQLQSRPISLSVRYAPRFHPPLEGRTTFQSTTVNVTSDPSPHWKPYDRIWGEGIRAGTYVTAVSPTSLTLSAPATATTPPNQPIRLFDADLYRFTGTPV